MNPTEVPISVELTICLEPNVPDVVERVKQAVGTVEWQTRLIANTVHRTEMLCAAACVSGVAHVTGMLLGIEDVIPPGPRDIRMGPHEIAVFDPARVKVRIEPT